MVPRVVKRPAEPFSTGIGFHVRATHKVLSRRLADELATLGIGLKAYWYLRALFEENGLTQVELGARVGMNRATVTRVVDTMARAGLVRRRRDPDDRRKFNVVLTARAEALRHPLRRVVEQVNRDALASIPISQVAALRDGLRAVIANLGGDL
jgi:DNA-binding MarR family transcriptional regulator